MEHYLPAASPVLAIPHVPATGRLFLPLNLLHIAVNNIFK